MIMPVYLDWASEIYYQELKKVLKIDFVGNIKDVEVLKIGSMYDAEFNKKAMQNEQKQDKENTL